MSSVTGILRFAFILLTLSFSAAYVFSAYRCPWCDKAKDLLKSQQISFHVVELDALPNGQGFNIYEEIKAKTGQNTVPNIFIKGQHIGGFDSLNQLTQNGLLKQYTGNSQNKFEL